MLKMIDETLDSLITTTSEALNQSNIYITKILEVMEYEMPMSATEIMKKLNI